MQNWKYPFILLFGIGVSRLGDWIYFVALNLLVLDVTGSPAAVAGLYMIRPFTILIVNSWSGSLIDRVNQRQLLIIIDLVRAVLVACIPFFLSIWVIYFCVFLINVAGSFFNSTSTAYITKVVPKEQRKQFNSFLQMITSGAFLVGPSISGFLILFTSTNTSIFINAGSFLVSAIVLFFLPNVDRKSDETKEKKGFAWWETVIEDWSSVIRFGKSEKYFLIIYLLFQGAALLGASLDSQEATFIKQNLRLSDAEYGLLVSIAGAGNLVGSFVVSLTVRKLSIQMMIGIGIIFTSLGYLVFYLSSDFLLACIAFIVLGFFLAFANTGYMTLYQEQVPIEIMGRMSSITNWIQGAIQILLVLGIGFAAELLSLQIISVIFSIFTVIFSLMLCVAMFLPSKRKDLNIGT